MMGVGVNCFGLRKPFFENFEHALTKLKECGVTSLEATVAFPCDPEAMPDFPKDGNFDPKFVEASIWPYDEAKDKIQYVREKGFKVIGVHPMCFLKDPNGLLKLIPKIKQLSLDCRIPYFVFSPMKRPDELFQYVPVFHEICESLEEVGAKLLIHNHEMECEMIDNKTGLEMVLEQCPLLGVELDVGWAKFAGRDPVELMDKIKNNLELVHLKDIKPDASPETRASCFSAIGEGSIPLAEIMNKAKALGLAEDRIIIDQDDSEQDMLDDIAVGVKNITDCL